MSLLWKYGVFTTPIDLGVNMALIVSRVVRRSVGPLTGHDVSQQEHLGRGTGRHVDTLIVTLEPYYTSLETSRRCAELEREIGIPRMVAVANKTRGDEDRTAIRDSAARHGVTLVGEIPMDDRLRKADLAAARRSTKRGLRPSRRFTRWRRR